MSTQMHVTSKQPRWLHFFERPYPSANMVLVHGSRPLLVDTGFGSDSEATEALLRGVNQLPGQLALIVNTHYHSDHVGGNHALQQRYQLPIAAHRWEAALINQREPEACAAMWLRQPVESYTVEQLLTDGDLLDTGEVVLQVLHTPGHTLGHISLYTPDDHVLICGDAFHRDDVAWIGLFREGVGAIQRAMETLDRLAALPLRIAYSGHGPATEHPHVAIDAARRRYEKWLAEPEKPGWHACKRIFTFALMIEGPLRDDQDTLTSYFLQKPWFLDYARHVFRREPADFVLPLVQEVVRSGGVGRQNGYLVALTPHNPPPAHWSPQQAHPEMWSRPMP